MDGQKKKNTDKFRYSDLLAILNYLEKNKTKTKKPPPPKRWIINGNIAQSFTKALQIYIFKNLFWYKGCESINARGQQNNCELGGNGKILKWMTNNATKKRFAEQIEKIFAEQIEKIIKTQKKTDVMVTKVLRVLYENFGVTNKKIRKKEWDPPKNQIRIGGPGPIRNVPNSIGTSDTENSFNGQNIRDWLTTNLNKVSDAIKKGEGPADVEIIIPSSRNTTESQENIRKVEIKIWEKIDCPIVNFSKPSDLNNFFENVLNILDPEGAHDKARAAETAVKAKVDKLKENVVKLKAKVDKLKEAEAEAKAAEAEARSKHNELSNFSKGKKKHTTKTLNTTFQKVNTAIKAHETATKAYQTAMKAYKTAKMTLQKANKELEKVEKTMATTAAAIECKHSKCGLPTKSLYHQYVVEF